MGNEKHINDRFTDESVKGQSELLQGSPHATFVDYFPLPLLVVNDRRQIVLGNAAFKSLLGIESMDEFLSLRPGEALGCIYAHSSPRGCGASDYCTECGAMKTVSRCIAEHETISNECQLLLDIHSEVSARDFRIHVYPWDLEGTTFYVITIDDIADEKRRRVLERLFFHDILNSAGGAHSLVELLAEAPTDRKQHLLGVLDSALFGLVEEIKKHKDLTAIENREYEVSPLTLQGLELAQNLVDEYAAHPLAHGKHLVLDQKSEPVSVHADFVLLRRVLTNMLINALEAVHAGDTVTMTVRPEGGQALFSIANPSEMPRSVQLQIFKRSFSTKGEGRGLGTYSIKLLTENYLEGKVGFSSDAASGTTFWIRIPVSRT